jgi:hypothetical protein
MEERETTKLDSDRGAFLDLSTTNDYRWDLVWCGCISRLWNLNSRLSNGRELPS